MSNDSSWIDLLQRNGLTPTKASRASLRVSESTPKTRHKAGAMASLKEEVATLRAERQRQGELLEKLTTDNSRLISQVERCREANETLESELSEERLQHDRVKASLEMVQLTANELEKTVEEKDKSVESLLGHVHSLQDEVHQLAELYQQQGEGQPLVSDLERLTVHNAELCDRLAATQHSRTVLEREILTLKRKLLEEKTVNGRLDQLLLSSEREKATLKNQLAQFKNDPAQQSSLEALSREKEELSERLKSSERQMDSVREELDQLREAQLVEIEERCREVDSLKAQLEGEVAALQQDAIKSRDEVRLAKAQLAKSEGLNSQLTAERKTFQLRIEQLNKQVESEGKNCAKLHQQLEKMSQDLEASLSELEANKISNLLLKQQVSDYDGQLEATKEQLRSRVELSNEMKVLLDQRAARIRQLEATLSKKREELDVSMETVSELLNASRESEDALDCVSVASSIMSSPAHRINSRTKFSSSQTEVLHLKQRLSESRQSTVRLEMKVAQLRTDNAKLLGSQQALNTIREQLSQENCRLSAREREMDDEWQRERERLTDQVNSMTAEADQLREQLHVQRQQLMARVGELEEENQTLSLTELASESQSRLEHVEVELGQLTRVLQDQERWIGRETEVCGGEMTALRTELTKIEESSKLTAAMNEATHSQLQVCESSICELIGEVEILRARRTVIMKHGGITQSDTATVTLHNRKLEGEVNELRAALQQCSCGALSRDQSCDQLERGLKDRLRSQTRQTNYCRVKLGYALSELRLYKELKVAMESHVAELQSTIESLKCQYQQCLERLHQAEALGFTTNTSLFTTAVS